MDEVDQVNDIVQTMVQNVKFMTAMKTDPGLGPQIVNRLQDPKLLSKITISDEVPLGFSRRFEC